MLRPTKSNPKSTVRGDCATREMSVEVEIGNGAPKAKMECVPGMGGVPGDTVCEQLV